MTYMALYDLGSRSHFHNLGLPGCARMPPPQRYLRALFLGALALAVVAFAAPQQAVAQGQTDPLKKGAAPELVLPSAESIVVLIRSTLLSLNDALRTDNYTVLRDLASPSFREANTAGRLHQIFANLSAQRIDLAAVAILPPKLPQPPSIDQDRRLHIAGYFPGEPVQVNFELVFEAVGNQWRLFGISVNPTKSTGADINPAATSRPAADKKGSIPTEKAPKK